MAKHLIHSRSHPQINLNRSPRNYFNRIQHCLDQTEQNVIEASLNDIKQMRKKYFLYEESDSKGKKNQNITLGSQIKRPKTIQTLNSNRSNNIADYLQFLKIKDFNSKIDKVQIKLVQKTKIRKRKNRSLIMQRRKNNTRLQRRPAIFININQHQQLTQCKVQQILHNLVELFTELEGVGYNQQRILRVILRTTNKDWLKDILIQEKLQRDEQLIYSKFKTLAMNRNQEQIYEMIAQLKAFISDLEALIITIKSRKIHEISQSIIQKRVKLTTSATEKCSFSKFNNPDALEFNSIFAKLHTQQNRYGDFKMISKLNRTMYKCLNEVQRFMRPG